MTDVEPFPDLFEMGQAALELYRKEFLSYGIETDPELRVHRGTGLLCYYDFNDRQIYLSMPDLRAPTGKLQLLMLRQMMGAESNEKLMRFLAIFVPFVVAHEMTHHLRHRYGLFSDDSWFEEQLANKLAAAVNKFRLPPEEKAFALGFLERSMKTLGEQIGLGQDAVDSYYDIAHALHSSDQISDEEMINFRMAQGMASDLSSASRILESSGNLPANLQNRLEKRKDLISNFNQKYASDAARYIYYQVGWTYLAMKIQDSSYVSEFACRHLGMAPELLDPHLPEQVNTDSIYGCYKASVECRHSFPTISRYFYKRYRALLLSHLKRNHREVFRNVKEIEDLNFDFLSTWNDRVKDPLNFMIDFVVPSARVLFPSRITKCIELATTPLPEALPTPLDRSVFQYALNPVDGPVRNTVDSLERLDRLELLRSLPPEVMIEISRRLYKVLYAAGETLVWEGEENSDVFILLEGELDVFRKDQSNVGVIHPGDVFGEIAWLTKRTRVATVRASIASTCLVIKDNDLRFLCYQNPGILMAIAERTAHRFSSI